MAVVLRYRMSGIPGIGVPGGLITWRGLLPSVWNDALAIRSKNSPFKLAKVFQGPPCNRAEG